MEGRKVEQCPFFVYKIIIIGNPGVGKTCLAIRYSDEEYVDNKQVTVGIDFKDKRLMIDEIRVRLNIFDTAGQETYSSLIRSYYREVDAVIFAFSIADKRSFQDIKKWVKEFEHNTDSSEAIKVLVGTQSDRETEREVTKEESLGLMEELGFVFFFETSSKEDKHVGEVFEEIARNLLLKMYKKRQKMQSSNKGDLIQILSHEVENSTKCC